MNDPDTLSTKWPSKRVASFLLVLLILILFVTLMALGPDRQPTKPEVLSPSIPKTPAVLEPPGHEVIRNIGGGFLWKPVSSSDNNLVVLLPSSMTGQTVTSTSTIFTDAECTRMHPDGDGRYAGVHNDNREHFRFTVPGRNFAGTVWFSVRLKNGSQLVYSIDSPGDRVER